MSAGLVMALLAIIFVLQNRAQIAKWIAGPPDRFRLGAHSPQPGRDLARPCRSFTSPAIYLIYALRIHGGFVYVARATTLSLIVIVAAQVVARFVRELSRRGFAISPELKAQFPTLEQRANRYIPILTGLWRRHLSVGGADRAPGVEYRGLCLAGLGFGTTHNRQCAVDRPRALRCVGCVGNHSPARSSDI